MGRGRPRKEIDVKQFEALCRMQCSIKEIAGFFECGLDTIERFCKRTYKKSFSETFQEKRVGGLISLRRSQFQLAEKNATMAIFLGKNYLGQRDVVEQKTNVEIKSDPLVDLLKESADQFDAWVDGGDIPTGYKEPKEETEEDDEGTEDE